MQKIQLVQFFNFWKPHYWAIHKMSANQLLLLHTHIKNLLGTFVSMFKIVCSLKYNEFQFLIYLVYENKNKQKKSSMFLSICFYTYTTSE